MSYTIKREFGKIYITFSNGDETKIGYTDDVEGLRRIVEASSWSNWKNKYIYSSKYKNYLHQVVMEFWHGTENFQKSKGMGFVVDHIDNNGFNCQIENLYFLHSKKNLHYKGNWYDPLRAEKSTIAALQIFSNFKQNKFQITIGFNKPFIGNTGIEISSVWLLYCDKSYDLVLSDALHILESLDKGMINFTELRHNKGKYKTVSRIQTSSKNALKGGNVIQINGEWHIVKGEGFKIESIAPDKDLWNQ
jgi:hypothetical protein